MTGRGAGSALRVLAVTNMYPTESDVTYGVFVKTQMDSLARAGLQVRVESVDGRRSVWAYARGVVRVRNLVASGDYDLVHAHYGLTGFVCGFQALPLVVSFCGDDLLGTPNGRGGITAKSRLGIRLSHTAARRAEAIICKSEQMRACLPRDYDRSRAHVIPNGVDTTRFAPGDRAAARARIGIDVKERVVLFPSTPSERRKRMDLAEASVTVLRSRGIESSLVVVQGVSPDRMVDYYRAADCLLLTSDWEGSPNVVKEALCADLPVVSVDVGDVRRWMGLALGCVLVDRSPDAIAEGLRQVLLSTPNVDGSRVRQEVGLERIAGSIIDVYREALARSGSGAPAGRHSAA